MPTDKKTIKEYNKNFKEWLNKKGLSHSHLEKPAMYSKLGNIKGKKILSLGCGAGEECAYIKSLGAKEVAGIDISKKLIAEAKKNFLNIEFYVMDMEKLKFAKSSFDLVYSSLVLHYVKDWTKVLIEIRKVLKKNGIFLFSTHNPVYWGALKEENKKEKLLVLVYNKNKQTGNIRIYGDYLQTRKINDLWFNNFKVTYWHKPFSLIIKDILKSGFKIIDCIEPGPLNSSKKIDYWFWKSFNKLPLFVIFKLQK
ncbi:MAG: class I SAM-dependent methyltransferase [Armatimonadetes bacterium]|nr:class I SAM-dependent methyltransferase [Armatimonadota bacterium]